MIQIYSTQLRKKTPFEPKVPGTVTMYVCGPTVYDLCHIGNARAAVVFDTIRRYLEYAGNAVTFISNITDIDDKIIQRAAEKGISCRNLTNRYQDEYELDMALLGVRSPTIRPKATEHIQDMINLIKVLEDKGVAYTSTRGVWFDISKYPEYGKLSGRTVDDDTTEHRVQEDTEKKNPQDFALWKFSKPGEPEWDSPWGKGRPGWHIECSAMSGRYCNHQLDIHGGGIDLQFPHHENEIAQSEAATGLLFVKYWMHNGFVTVQEEDSDEEIKMGKSKGNVFLTRNACQIARPAAIRLWMLGTHYRGPLLYRLSLLGNSESSLDRLYNCADELLRVIGDKGIVAGDDPFSQVAEKADEDFRAAMDDDFNTPQALAVVYDFVNAVNSAISGSLSKIGAGKALSTLQAHLGVLGLPADRPKAGSADTDRVIRILVELRAEARSNKNFELSDAIRDHLADAGIVLNDRDGETTWTL